MSGQTHRSDPRILGRRTLQRDHKRLAALLKPGMSVLDVGCGTGSITAGIAEAVGPEGRVTGIDRDESLLAIAREAYRSPNLKFEQGDIRTLTFTGGNLFDIATAARTLQWIHPPEDAISSMARTVKPDGRIVVLDYNHESNSWNPAAPAEFMHFYSAFLAWRKQNGWINQMAENLPDLFRAQGLRNIEIHISDEVAKRGDPDFPAASGLWTHVIEAIGPQLIEAGFINDRERTTAHAVYSEWTKTTLQTQILEMRTVEATVP